MTRQLLPGTYGVVSGAGFIGGAIRLATRSHWSHAFVIVEGDQIVEAEAGGVKLSPLAKYHGKQVAFNDEEPLSVAEREGIVKHAMGLINTPYNYLDILALGLDSMGLSSDWMYDAAQKEKRLICSQAVARSYYLGAAIDLAHGRLDGRVTPANLADRITSRAWEPAF